jgi:tRNA-dihydrouridine synthase B
MHAMLDLKGLRIEVPVIQAPMCGCTDLPFRRILRRFGCALAFAEMVKDRAVIEGNRKTAELLATGEGDRPLGFQLAGREPALLAEAVRRLEQRGADVIDLNVGCPVHKIVRSGCGAALLKEPEQVGRIVEAMVAATRLPITIKMRAGFDAADGDRFVDIARLAEQAGAAAVTIHGRTRSQGFSGDANLDAIRLVKSVLRIPVIGNGNIRRGPDAARMMSETGCAAVMVGRGALGNPWIFRDIRLALDGAPEPQPPSVPERAAVLAEHFEGMCQLYGVERSLHIIRRVIHWYVKGVERSTDLRQEGNTMGSVGQFRDFVSRFSQSRPLADVRGGIPTPDPPALRAEEPGTDG